MTYTNSFTSEHRRRPARWSESVGGNAAATSPLPYSRTCQRYRSTTSYRAPSPRGPRRRKATVARAVLVLAFVAALAAAGWYAITSLSSLAAGATGGTSSSDAPQSTPMSAWHAGEVPNLYQRDPAWAQASYAGDSFSESGCGPTCLSMVYVALTGRTDRSPVDMGALSERLGCATSDGTAWLFMTEGAAEVGLTAEELPAEEAAVRRALASGSPVICSVGPGDFTTIGHFIVLSGIDQNGRLIVHDPNSPERSGKTWDFDTVLSQCRNLWAYTSA